MNKEGITMCDDKVRATTMFPTPKTVDDVPSFSGLAGFHRVSQDIHMQLCKVTQPLTGGKRRGRPQTRWTYSKRNY